jgi:TMEM175 potassium channel family protein
MADHPQPVRVISRSRLEMLFDGVFAIAMTLLVLELKVPEGVDRHNASALVDRLLLEQKGTFFSYLLSFTILGVFWWRHNHVYHYFRTITSKMLFLHFVQLAAAAFFPFTAALYGRYPINPGAVLFYVGCVGTYFWAAFGNLVVAKKDGALSDDLTPEHYTKMRRRGLRAALLMTAMFVMYVILAKTAG